MLRSQVAPADKPLTVEDELADAENATGLSDWGEPSFKLGFGILLEAVEEMRPPIPFRTMAKGRVQHLLRQRLHLRADERLRPEIINAEIREVRVVTGLPRSGTTVTYDLLALDPAARAPREWEGNSPWPAPEIASFETDSRIAVLNGMYQHILELAPHFANVQRLDAASPCECNTIMMSHFAGTNFWAEMSVPKHRIWSTSERAPGMYEWHKRVLQQLQWRGPRGRWTIKSPNHLFDLPGLLAVYPDAKIVWTHRDPVKTFSSLSSMVAMLQTAFGAPVDVKKIGEEITDIWCRALLAGLSARVDRAVEARIIDIAHRDVTERPADVVARIHAHFALPFDDGDARRITQFVAQHPSAQRLGLHEHQPETFGIDAAAVRARLEPYYERFRDLIA